ncbi:MAG TPA: ATP-binding cassette domain-containing protein [Candidatus Limiplasma sp.]|nr:ATP-binding cassette domain-containing protein [Candidatus Limiplasma sp.]HRX07564.1 ATP-binding cassette domain-containing protein [Candidatus Limiplasma sp.]
MLLIENLSVAYPARQGAAAVLKALSLSIPEGEVLAVLGPSGCGKTTLIHTLAGVVHSQSGRVVLERDGRQTPLNPKTHAIAVIPQNCGLLPWKTVRQNCLLPARLRGQDIGKAQAAFEQICEALKIGHLKDSYPNHISGGQLRRAAMARAFLQNPDVLLMDEPFTALDEITRYEAWDLFLSTWRQQRAVTILVTHSLEEALYLGREIAVMGQTGGAILSRHENPFFSQLQPDAPEYAALKKRLLHSLAPAQEAAL